MFGARERAPRKAVSLDRLPQANFQGATEGSGVEWRTHEISAA
jgi:hypothetical protein